MRRRKGPGPTAPTMSETTATATLANPYNDPTPTAIERRNRAGCQGRQPHHPRVECIRPVDASSAGRWTLVRHRTPPDDAGMKVSSVYRRETIHARASDSLLNAAQTMADRGLSCLPVLEAGTLVGVVLEHDIVDAFAHAVPASQACVADYATDAPVAVSPDDECDAARLKMLEVGCRDLPVAVGERLVGTVSARDLVEQSIQQPSAWPPEPPPDVDTEGEPRPCVER